MQSEVDVIELNEGLKKTLDRYIRQYGEDIRHILKLDKDELETEDIEVVNIISELIYEAFGIKVITIKNKKATKLQNDNQQLPINGMDIERLQINSIWMKHGELIIPKGILK